MLEVGCEKGECTRKTDGQEHDFRDHNTFNDRCRVPKNFIRQKTICSPSAITKHKD